MNGLMLNKVIEQYKHDGFECVGAFCKPRGERVVGIKMGYLLKSTSTHYSKGLGMNVEKGQPIVFAGTTLANGDVLSNDSVCKELTRFLQEPQNMMSSGWVGMMTMPNEAADTIMKENV